MFEGIGCFLVTMVLSCVLSMLKFVHLLHWRDADPGHLFYNYILTGFMFAFAAFLLLERYFACQKGLLLYYLSPSMHAAIYGLGDEIDEVMHKNKPIFGISNSG